jgi:hypothetical protein
MCLNVPLLEVFLGTLKILFSHIIQAGAIKVGSIPKDGLVRKITGSNPVETMVVNEGSSPSVL